MKTTTKRVIAWLVAALTSVTMQAYDFASGGVYYNITSNATASTPGTVTVTKGDGYSGTVTIPATVQNGGSNYNVTAIAPEAFQNSIHLTAVNIGSKVESIGYRAFSGCEELEEIVLPANVKTIDYDRDWSSHPSETFVGCNNLKRATLGGITSMGIKMFSGCTNLTTVTISEGCTVVGNNCFEGCTNLKAIEIPNTVTTIGKYAFQGCNVMTSAKVGNGVTTIGIEAFQGCTRLTKVTLGSKLRTIEYRAFADCEDLEEIILPDELAILDRKCHRHHGRIEPAG